MPLQLSGLIVAEKSKTVETNLQQTDAGVSAVTETSASTDQLQQQFYQTQQQTPIKTTNPVKYLDFFGTSDDELQLQQQQHNVCNNSNNLCSSQTQLPLMRRAQQRNISNNIHYIKNTVTSGGGGAATNTKNPQINVKKQAQMNKQQQQILQHNTNTTQQQQLGTHHQSKHQHVQKQQQLSQQQMHTTQHQQQQLYQQQQPTPQQQQQQQSQPQHQQVIQVSEEFIEQATGVNTTANMMISTTTGEVLNPQIFKIVATDGTTGNVIIDSGSATAVGGQSKVLLSNLTVLAKQSPNSNASTTSLNSQQQQQQHAVGVAASNSGGSQQQAQTINYMSAKNLPYLTTATSATPIGSTGVGVGSAGKTQKYTVTGTYKTGVKQQQQQQYTTTTSYIHQTQQQQSSSAQSTTTPQGGIQQTQQQQQQLYQKLPVPRQMQMLPRVQTVVQQQPTVSVGQQPQQQQHAQMLIQPVVGGTGGTKYLSSSATTKSASVTSAGGVGGIGGGGNILKKSANSLKLTNKSVNSMQMQQQQGVKTTYITQQQQQQQQYQLHQTQYQSGGGSGKIKTSKLLKQYNNVMNSSNNNNSSSGAGVNMPQQTLGTYTISGAGHKLQQTTKLTKVGGAGGSKYAINQQQLQHVATLPQGTHLHHKTMPHQQLQYATGNNLVTLASNGNNNNASLNAVNNASSTIKFVNSAHATVIQHQTNTLPMQQQQPQTKMALRHQQQQQQQQQIQFVDAPHTTIVKDNNGGGGNTIYQQQTQQIGNNNTATQSILNDDIMIVNGTQMTDELSARILQSMAQKSFSNQQRYQQQQQQTKAIVMPPPTAQQQQQQIVLQQHASPTSVLLSPKEYPIYSASGQQLSSAAAATTTITTQYTNAASLQHQTPVSATAYLPISAGAASYTSSNAIYATISSSTGSASTTIGRQTHSAPGSRTHSLERNKSYEASTTITRKTAVDYYKPNNTVGGVRGHHGQHASHNASTVGSLSSASTSNIPTEIQQHQQQQTSAQIIHLQTLKSSLAATTAAVAAGNSSYTIATNASATIVGGSGGAVTPLNISATTADDEDIIGEEVRPTPVNTQDLRLRILHAVQQDHTYANAMPAHLQHGSADSAKSGQAVNKTPGGQSHLQTALSGSSGTLGGSQQWSLGGIGATVGASGQAGLPTPPSSGQSTYTLHGQQIPRMQQDDDAHSAISNGSRVATGDIDPGEETETAPEAEAEDDSVTRCICDLTHDDGYMICCDKCFAWQHVDCMGIDRQNIPDEYQCEVCQPRVVDKARARSLQLMKRREQTQLLLSAQSAHATGSSGAYLSGTNAGGNYHLGAGGNTANSFLNADGTMQGLPNNVTTTKKGKVLKKTAKDTAAGKKSKKAEKLAGNLGGKAGRKEAGGAKKTTKRKTKSNDGLSATATAAEKHAANLRQWIENYELAVTNHYSPELRARLHAITKQPSLLQSILNTENRTLKDCCNNGLEIRATTVPHAGGKILISNMDIAPSCPIFELRGKYMLSPQYKTQNASVNMNSPPPSNYLAASLKAHKTPGPFIFFYQLPDAEAPMQTMNEDGSYPSLPPQPAYLKGPEICVDTRTYGNEARFVRRSCRPNAEIQHLFEKGTIHLFIVATTSIRASTEITIKHEPHDLLAIENKKATSSNCIVQPTSTACGCGLIKDCLFGPPPTHQMGGKTSSRKSSVVNGGVQLNSSAAAMQLTMGGLPTTSSGKKKGAAAQNINRNRSISSSGDSSNGGGAALAGSNIGGSGGAMNSPNATLPTASLGINATNLCNNTFKSNGGLNIISAHALAASGALPSNNGIMSAASSVSSVIHDSGICTSSSSPSVSIPSPSTLHMHSPTQHTQQQLPLQPQVQQAAQQPQKAQQQQQLLVPSTAPPTFVQQRGANNALFVQHSPQQQQQHQQILGALPTPLLLSPPPPPTPQLVPTQTPPTQTQSQPQLLQQPQQPQQQHQQHHQQQHMQNVAETLAINNQAAPPSLHVTIAAESEHVPIVQCTPTEDQPLNVSACQKSPREDQHLPEQQHQHSQQNHCKFVGPPTISDASLAAAAALQSLNTAVTLTSVCAAAGSPQKILNISKSIAISGAPKTITQGTLDVSDTEVQPLPQQKQQLPTPQQQQTQFNMPATVQTRPQDIVDGNTHITHPQQQQQQQPQQQSVIAAPPPQFPPTTPQTQTNTTPLVILSPSAGGSKSPQKHSVHLANSAAAPGALPHGNARQHKAPGGGKSSSSRSTSFSEDDHQQHQHNSSSGSVNDDSMIGGTSTSTSASKDKPKLSREDRKMEAILRAIEKMERNQQRKNQSKSGSTSGNATGGASSATKRRSSNMNSPTTPTKRALGEMGGVRGGASARKKKRKSHKSYSGQSAQARKRRKSRMNSSNESVDGAGVSGAGLPPPTSQNVGCSIFDGTANATNTVTNSMPSQPDQSVIGGPMYQHMDMSDTQLNQLPMEQNQNATAQANQSPATSNELATQSNEVLVDSMTPASYEDQAAGLLLAFAANPDIKVSTAQQASEVQTPPAALQQQQQYTAHQNYTPEHLKSPQHRIPTNGGANAASPPATPISSACLLIEAAVGPLQDQMDGSSPTGGDFKYPNKTKTKKVLMSNWLLNQVDTAATGSVDSTRSLNVPTSPLPMENFAGAGMEASGVMIAASTNANQMPPSNTTTTLSLESLVQAATMCDYSKQQHNEVASAPDTCNFTPMNELAAGGAPIDEPQNLSMAALKVEEFIQQTERVSNTSNYNQAAPGVAGAGGAAGPPPRNLLHLPLQVSTCSNNSSVKKRWLRQAISEETTTDDSAAATPTTAGAAAAAAPSYLQNASPTTAAHLNAAAAMLNVPNGFTTPLKKRRLIISGGAKEEEEQAAVGGGGGSSAPSPSSSSANCSYDSPVIGFVKTEFAVTDQDSARDAGVKAFNSTQAEEINVLDGNKNSKTNAVLKHEPDTTDEEADEDEYDEDDDEYEERADVDVVGGVSTNEIDTTTTTAANTSDECMREEEIIVTKKGKESDNVELARQHCSNVSVYEEIKPEAMLNDQDDDVDILRSPSPGHQQMLAAEDNLVKIEPEDTSAGYDVKIDVEREESLAGDRFEEMVLMQMKKEEEEAEQAKSAVTAVAVAVETKHAIKQEQKNVQPLLLSEGSDAHIGQAQQDSKLKVVKKEETQPGDESKPIKAEIAITKKVINSLVPTAASTVVEHDAEMPIIPTTSKSPLKLLTLDASSNVSTPDEPLKKRPKLDLVTSTPKENETQQTSLLKPLSARKLEMAKQNVLSNKKEAPIVSATPANAVKEVTKVDNNTKPTKLSTLNKSPKLNKPTTIGQKAQSQQNCMTFLAAAAAAAIERKPPSTASAIIPPTAAPAKSPESVNKSTIPTSQQPTAMQVEACVADNAEAPANNNGSNTTSATSMLAPRKQNATHATNNSNTNDRKSALTDDDLQARVHSFHKENILILQTRNNKKPKGNATTVDTQAVGNNASDLSKNTKSLTAQSHHKHNEPAKNAGSSKHSSGASKTLTNSNSSGGASSKKLHKKERSSNKEHSSSSSSNSRSSSTHSSGKLTASSSSSSSKKLSSSHKKDYAANNKQSQSASKQHTSTTVGSADSKEREERRDKERGVDKDRHRNRQRTTSSSNSTSAVTNVTTQAAQSTTPPNPPLSTKKRQLNFEQELTKDLALVNAALSSSSNRHRKDSGSARQDSREDTINSSCSSSGVSSSLTAAARKRRESSSSGGGSSRHRHNSSSSSSGAVVPAEQQKDATATVTQNSAAKEHNGIIETAVAASSQPLTAPHAPAHVPLPQLPPPPSVYVRTEHAALPHFNNVVVSGAAPPAVMAAYLGGIGAVPGSNIDPASMITPIATYVPTPGVALSTVNAAAQQPPYSSLLKTLPIQPALNHLAAATTVLAPPQQAAMSSASSSSALAVLAPPTAAPTILNSVTNAPMSTAMSPVAAVVGGLPNLTSSTYNSIYGKLRDTTPTIVPPPTTTPSTLNAPAAAASPVVTASASVNSAAQTPAVSANISLSEYLDTKVKSYSTTLGAYVSPSCVAGSNATGSNSVTKPIVNNSTSNNISSASDITPCAAAASTTLESSIVSKLPTPLKMLPLTRTASHDPRLNPQLNVPEPPPAPKRKLSINEYRKRMQLSSDATTPGTPDNPATNSSSPTTPASAGANSLTTNSLNNSFAQAYNSIVNASPEEMARQLSSSPTTLNLNKYTLNSPERKRRYSGSEKDHHHRTKRHSSSFEDGTVALNSSTGSSSSGHMSDASSTTNLHNDDDGKKGQFSAAPTLLEKQQEKLCERLKLLRNMNKGVTSLSTGSNEFGTFKKDCDLYMNRTNSTSSTDNLDNCLEEISSSSSSSSTTSRASSRGVTPERSLNSVSCVKTTNVENEITTTTTTTTTKTSNAPTASTPNKHDAGKLTSDNDAAT